MEKSINLTIYPIYRMFGIDFLFYYAIKVLFLVQVKNISGSEILIASAIYGLFRVVSQIPVTIIVDKFGKKNSIILGNILNALYILLVMFCNNFIFLALIQPLTAIAFSIKGIAEPVVLQDSIEDNEKKSEIFSRIDGNGLSKYYYLNAISSLVSGILFEKNPYIPLILCFLGILFSTFISTRFIEKKRNNKKIELKIKERIVEYTKEFKSSFKFIFKSRRLISLILYTGFLYGFICLLDTYEITLLEELNFSATTIGIIIAILSILSGISSKKSNKFHRKYKNKSLTYIACIYIVSVLIIGILAIAFPKNMFALFFILVLYAVRYADLGFYHVLTRKYLGNFSTTDLSPKIYAVSSVSSNLGKIFTELLGAFILSKTITANAMIFLSCIFLIIIAIIIKFMNTRLGLKPEEYREQDIKMKVLK